MAYACEALSGGKRRRGAVKLTQVGTRRKAVFARAADDASGGFWRERGKCGDELLEFGEHGGTDFVRWFAIQCYLEDAITQFPSQCFACRRFHSDFPCEASRSRAPSYKELISAAKRAVMAVRRSLPMAVKRPLSAVSVSLSSVKLRIWR